MALQLDTSGVVRMPDRPRAKHMDHAFPALTIWSDLSPFTQGYVEAMFEELWRTAGSGLAHQINVSRFRHLAPETLARIMEDCAWFMALDRRPGWLLTNENGHAFWHARQGIQVLGGWVAITPYLGDDGKVYLR